MNIAGRVVIEVVIAIPVVPDKTLEVFLLSIFFFFLSSFLSRLLPLSFVFGIELLLTAVLLDLRLRTGSTWNDRRCLDDSSSSSRILSLVGRPLLKLDMLCRRALLQSIGSRLGRDIVLGDILL